MLYKSYPKVNLYLHIVGKTPSNYHLLRSRFVRVVGDLYDEIAISQAPKDRACDSVLGNFPCEIEHSSVYLALQALRKVDGVRFPPVRIEVQKHIPSGAGLGGGSSNAGVVLAALIARYGAEFKGEAKQMHAYFTSPKPPNSPLPTALSDLAKNIGADVAFFVSQVDCAEVSGIGERIAPCDSRLNDIARFSIYTPKIACNTAQVYRHYAATSTPNPHIKNYSTLSNAAILASGDMTSLNDLFAPACSLYKELESVAKELGEGWFFSGSGSSFFRIDSRGDSALGRHSADFGDLEATADLKSSSAPKSPKNSKSPTATPRILEEEKHALCEKSASSSLRALQSKAWQSISSQVDSRIFTQNAQSVSNSQAVGFEMRNRGFARRDKGATLAVVTEVKPKQSTIYRAKQAKRCERELAGFFRKPTPQGAL